MPLPAPFDLHGAVTTAPPAPRIFDKKFIALNGGYLTVALLDSELTQLCIHGGTCQEGNSWMPKSQGGQIGVAFAMAAGATGVSYYLRKHNSRLWWVPTSVGIAAHGVGIASGVRYFEWRFVVP
jgi:hypothetical protein